MATCREVTRALASDDLAAGGRRRRLALKLHLLWCRHCRRYARQLRSIGRAAREMFGPRSEEPAVLERLERAILDRSTAVGEEDRPHPH